MTTVTVLPALGLLTLPNQARQSAKLAWLALIIRLTELQPACCAALANMHHLPYGDVGYAASVRTHLSWARARALDVRLALIPL